MICFTKPSIQILNFTRLTIKISFTKVVKKKVLKTQKIFKNLKICQKKIYFWNLEKLKVKKK